MSKTSWVGLLLAFSLPCQALINADFDAASGTWQDRDGPPGWELRLDGDGQYGIVEEVDFAHAGSRSFRFSHLQRGFGGSRIDQCVVLVDPFAVRLSVHVRVEEPHPELSARLRLDFYADEACDEESSNADLELVQSDIGLSEVRTPAHEWVRLDSETRLGSELGDDVRSMRVSLRVRDRSEDGQPRDPARRVWMDSVSLEADVNRIPADQRQVLRDLYESTGGEQWTRQLGWMGAEGTECEWQGVACNDEGDEVIALSLPRNGLIGSLPESIASLSEIELGEGLDLCWNEILVPEEIAGFVNPRHLGGDPGHCQSIEPLALSRDASGHFFQPMGRDGEGFMLHMLGEGAGLLYWATYNDFGDPVWLVANGRAHDRVMQFKDLYHTRWEDGGLEVERIGRASLVLVADENDSDCRASLLRFHVQGEGFGAGDGRELSYLDGLADCVDASNRDPLLSDLEGHWFDPDQAGRGISLMPFGTDQLLLNWFTYDDTGQQVWQIGIGSRDGTAERVEFGPLLMVSGGNFNDFIDPSILSLTLNGIATLENLSSGWRFHYQHDGSDVLQLNLVKAMAGPDLLASTGNRIDVIMQWPDLDELYGRSIWSDERLPGQVRFNLEPDVHDLTGLRFRGNSSRQLPKKSLNIRFERLQPLLFGSDRMNLNAMYTDPTMMRESLSFELFHSLGQPAPLTRYFDLWLNGLYEGTGLHIQRIDEWLLTLNALNPDGTLVRDEFRDNTDLPSSSFAFDFSGLELEESLDLLADNFNSRGDPDWQAVLELIEWVRSTPPGTDYASGFEQRINLENFIDWMAIHWLIGDIDSFADDYWLYLDHDDPQGRWHFIPWDKDLSFGSHWRSGYGTANDYFIYEHPLAGGWGNVLISRFLATPELRLQLEQRLLELMEFDFPQEWFFARFDELAEYLADSVSIEPSDSAFRRHERNHHGQQGRYADHVESLKDFIELRFRFIERQLAAQSGPAYQADIEVQAGETGKQFATDANGWTVMAIEPDTEFEAAFTLEALVEPAEVRGIDREWTVTFDEAPGRLVLTVYYRNDVHVNQDSWWTEDEEAISDQDLLQMAVTRPDGVESVLPTRINPYSNKAVAELDMEEGEYRVRLVLQD